MEALMASSGGSGPGVECFAASRPMEGQDVCGDASVCQAFEGGTLISAIDGLGHGEEAAAAARLAKNIIERHAAEPLLELVRRCDSQMRHTRGAAASLARFDLAGDTLSWVGVGNVEGVLLCRRIDGSIEREGMALRGGVIGYNLPPLRLYTRPVSVGDVLVLATDGLASSFTENIDYAAGLRETAEGLLERYGKQGDDALVIAARYIGDVP